MPHGLAQFFRVEFAPPRYLSMPTAGVDISTSGIKIACLVERYGGLELAAFGEEKLPNGAVVGGEIADHAAVVEGVKKLAKKHRIHFANIALPEARGYLFEADVAGHTSVDWKTAVEQRLDEYVPLPPNDVVFDVTPIEETAEGAHVVGVGYAKRVVAESLQSLLDAGVAVRSVESENFALPRALLRHGDSETVLIIDIGKTTTKLLFVDKRVPRFTTTLDIGGHALTLAVQKHFGVTEEEAKQVKAEKGIAGGENDEYMAAMLSTVSVIREEILRRLDYWRTHGASAADGTHEPVARAILVGGNATVRGLPEYLETAFKIPVELGDVFVNLAPRGAWVPSVDYMESLAYGTAIGLALRDHLP